MVCDFDASRMGQGMARCINLWWLYVSNFFVCVQTCSREKKPLMMILPVLVFVLALVVLRCRPLLLCSGDCSAAVRLAFSNSLSFQMRKSQTVLWSAWVSPNRA